VPGGRHLRNPNPATYAPLAEAWNGTSWSVQATPDPGGAVDGYLQGVSCTSPRSSCAAAGYFLTANQDGVTLGERYS